MDQRRQQGGSSNGFILGVIVGVLLTLLLTTKKGRKILHTLTEEGLGKVSGKVPNLEELFAEEEDLIEDGSDYVKDVAAAPMEEEAPKMRLKTHKPRLFRGVPKRTSVYKN